jgi:hypothetical protein
MERPIHLCIRLARKRLLWIANILFAPANWEGRLLSEATALRSQRPSRLQLDCLKQSSSPFWFPNSGLGTTSPFEALFPVVTGAKRSHVDDETEFQEHRRSQPGVGNENQGTDRYPGDLTTLRLRVVPLLLFKRLSPRTNFKHLKLSWVLPIIFLMIFFCRPEFRCW